MELTENFISRDKINISYPPPSFISKFVLKFNKDLSSINRETVRPEILKNKRKEGKQNPSHQSEIFQNFLVFVRTFQPRRHSPLKFQFESAQHGRISHTRLSFFHQKETITLSFSLSLSIFSQPKRNRLAGIPSKRGRERERKGEGDIAVRQDFRSVVNVRARDKVHRDIP